jgi:hypothetical protein
MTTAGLGNTGSYQASGRPLVIQSPGAGPTEFSLSFVTKAITVSVPTGALNPGTISFDGDGTTFDIAVGESYRFEVRVVKFSIGGANTQVMAELTNIPAPDPTLLATDATYHTP